MPASGFWSGPPRSFGSNAELNVQFVFFGANDASLPGALNKQHIPLDQYKKNLETIIRHPRVAAHNPRVILITPPPIDEHSMAVANPGQKLERVAATTKAYADAVCEVGEKLHVPVVNLWNVFMARTGWTADAWKTGDHLPGSTSLAQHDALVELLSDGMLLVRFPVIRLTASRAAFQPHSVQSPLQGSHQGHIGELAGSAAGKSAHGAACLE